MKNFKVTIELRVTKQVEVDLEIEAASALKAEFLAISWKDDFNIDYTDVVEVENYGVIALEEISNG